MIESVGLWQKIQELAPSRQGHDRQFLKDHIGPHIGTLTIQTLAKRVLGIIELEGTIPATLVMQPDGLGHSGSEVFKLAFYDDRPAIILPDEQPA